MFVQCSVKNVVDQASVKNYALFKLQSKLEKLTNTPIGLYLMIKQDKSCVLIDCKLLLGENKNSIVLKSIQGVNFFEAIDNLANKMDRAIRKKKTQKEKQRKHSSVRKMTYTNDMVRISNQTYDYITDDMLDEPYYEEDSMYLSPRSISEAKWII